MTDFLPQIDWTDPWYQKLKKEAEKNDPGGEDSYIYWSQWEYNLRWSKKMRMESEKITLELKPLPSIEEMNKIFNEAIESMKNTKDH